VLNRQDSRCFAVNLKYDASRLATCSESFLFLFNSADALVEPGRPTLVGTGEDSGGVNHGNQRFSKIEF